jgi:hypothetical protein
MLNRTFQIYCATTLIAVAVPLYAYFGRPTGVLAAACMVTMAPAVLLCSVLPHQLFLDHTYLTPIDGDFSGRHARILVSMLVSMNVLFWIVAVAAGVYVVRYLGRMRRRI